MGDSGEKGVPGLLNIPNGPGAKERKVSTRLATVASPHVVCMVGLPASGKTYISKKLSRYLNWIGITTKVFNVGEYRRKQPRQYGNNHDFFRSTNAEAMAVRAAAYDECLKDALAWLQRGGGEVAIFDASYPSRQFRQMIHKKVVLENQFKCLFLESICDDPEIIESCLIDVKVHGPDYKDLDKEEAIQDYLQRIQNYKDVYEPIHEDLEVHTSFMKVYNAGEKVVINRHEGNLQSRIVYWLMNIHLTPRTIYLSRHGESQMNLAGRIGGDSNLSPRGQQYACALSQHINEQDIPGLVVWTSWFKRTIQTAAKIEAPQERWKALNEIHAGVCEQMTYKEIEEKFPAEFAARDLNKLNYRYPGGESYEDLVARLEPVIMELERKENVFVVGHQAVLRCILGYFLEKDIKELPYIRVPLHTLIKLTPVAYGCEVEHIAMPIEAVDTHREKPEDPTHHRLGLSCDEIEVFIDKAREGLQIDATDKVVSTIGGPKIQGFQHDQHVKLAEERILSNSLQ